MRRPGYRIVPFAQALAACCTLTGCIATSTESSGTGAAAPVAAAAAPSGPPTCTGPLAEYQAVIDADLRTGNVNTSVHRRIAADLEGVRAICAAGRAGEANSRLAGVKTRYGYR